MLAGLDRVFIDSPSPYFHGEGGANLGWRGKSRNFLPQCKQLVVGMVLDRDGFPVCSQIWPGNTADVTTPEHALRACESILDTRPIFHKCDEFIRGHEFFSFLALVLQSELRRRMDAAGIRLGDLNAFHGETEIGENGDRFLVRSATRGSIAVILRCAGVPLPNTIRQIEPEQDLTAAG